MIVFTDSFTTTVSGNLDTYPAGAPDYAFNIGSGNDLRVSSTDDRVQSAVADIDCAARIIRAGMPTGDQQITITVSGGASIEGQALTRMATTGNLANYYLLGFEPDSADEVRIWRCDDGVFTIIASADRGLIAGTHTLRFKVTGTGASVVLEAQVDATAVLTYTDTSANRKISGVPGIGLFQIVADTAWVDNVSVDNLLAASLLTYYVATTGSDANTGTIGAPFATIQKAHDIAVPGDIIYVRGGTYTPTVQQTLTRDGSAGNVISLLAYTGELPILDNVGMASGWIIRMTGANYWQIKGLEPKGAPSCIGGGIWVEDSSNVNIELNNVHHCGLTGILVTGSCSNVILLNNDSHHNKDDVAVNGGYSDADGIRFSAIGTGNVMRGNRAWRNANNGIDLAEASPLLGEENWFWENGYNDSLQALGEGVGFKLGGTGSARTTGGHTVQRNLSWRNRARGFDDGLYPDDPYLPLILYNNTAWDSPSNFNIIHDSTITNNIAFPLLGAVAGPDLYNSWTVIEAVDADFVSLDFTGAAGARQADGSPPDLNFLKLVPGSNQIDAGIYVGLPFLGGSPDLGAREFVEAPPSAPDPGMPLLPGIFNPYPALLNF